MDFQDVLIGEQIKHMVDVMDAKLDRIELNQDHLKELIEHRLKYLEKQAEDHETRIRVVTEGVTQNKVKSGLTSAGSGILSIFSVISTEFWDDIFRGQQKRRVWKPDYNLQFLSSFQQPDRCCPLVYCWTLVLADRFFKIVKVQYLLVESRDFWAC